MIVPFPYVVERAEISCTYLSGVAYQLRFVRWSLFCCLRAAIVFALLRTFAPASPDTPALIVTGRCVFKTVERMDCASFQTPASATQAGLIQTVQRQCAPKPVAMVATAHHQTHVPVLSVGGVLRVESQFVIKRASMVGCV